MMPQTFSLRSLAISCWSQYKLHARNVMQQGLNTDKKVLQHWRNKLFCDALTLAFPISLIATIPSIITEIHMGYRSMVVVDLLILSFLGFLVFNRSISLEFRKLSIAVLITVFVVLLLCIMGSFSMGCIYLFALSICMALLYSGWTAFAGVIVNFVICLGFALILNYQLFGLPLLTIITLERWILYSSNFLFTDFILVALINQLLNGLDKTITKESSLYERLRHELLLKNEANELLGQSEEHYRTLFSQSPLAISIFDQDNLCFLQVNEAATQIYGYSAQELLNLCLTDIQAPKEILESEEILVDQSSVNDLSSQETAIHIRKDGQLIYVEIKSSDFLYQGKAAQLIIAKDITLKVNQLIAIKKQNEKLKQIAYMQSHVIRVPLANIIGLSNLIMEELTSESQKDLFNYLDVSVKQLDNVIRDIVNHPD